ncbi:hypothetical protein [Rosenbergiella nectarea]|uniref:hypothetical protein n=1 Tax=Rosenbergiella nectarea TaxID=988801 RepID=UPI001F4DB3DC|nr:hypothetical protein [Rosenbergiella nectarea]
MKSSTFTFTDEQFNAALQEAELTREDVEGGKIENIENRDFSLTQDIDVMFSLPADGEDF